MPDLPQTSHTKLMGTLPETSNAPRGKAGHV
jgi:hypothetical protein